MRGSSNSSTKRRSIIGVRSVDEGCKAVSPQDTGSIRVYGQKTCSTEYFSTPVRSTTARVDESLPRKQPLPKMQWYSVLRYLSTPYYESFVTTTVRHSDSNCLPNRPATVILANTLHVYYSATPRARHSMLQSQES